MRYVANVVNQYRYLGSHVAVYVRGVGTRRVTVLLLPEARNDVEAGNEVEDRWSLSTSASDERWKGANMTLQ